MTIAALALANCAILTDSGMTKIAPRPLNRRSIDPLTIDEHRDGPQQDLDVEAE